MIDYVITCLRNGDIKAVQLHEALHANDHLKAWRGHIEICRGPLEAITIIGNLLLKSQAVAQKTDAQGDRIAYFPKLDLARIETGGRAGYVYRWMENFKSKVAEDQEIDEAVKKSIKWSISL